MTRSRLVLSAAVATLAAGLLALLPVGAGSATVADTAPVAPVAAVSPTGNAPADNAQWG
ncbi:hypothetical protein ACFW1A_09225 [Kitasatospora sp. NPDC058965]|uniref:hypothetical protein n=1 Tax=Kitasatospora sp. NPDC058965 TaxID=3346682 RepID=UPI0036753B28